MPLIGIFKRYSEKLSNGAGSTGRISDMNSMNQFISLHHLLILLHSDIVPSKHFPNENFSYFDSLIFGENFSHKVNRVRTFSF